MKRLTQLLAPAIFVLSVAPLAANAPDNSMRPTERPVAQTDAAQIPAIRPMPRPAAQAAVPAAVPNAALRPVTRPKSEQQLAAAQMSFIPQVSPQSSVRPIERPDAVVELALFKKRKLRRGSVCGDIDLQGEKVGNVAGKWKGCGVKNAVKITSVAGVKLSQSAVMDCDTANALKKWVERGLKPAFRRRGPVVEMRVAAHYICRTRNNQKGAKISEHGKGKAIDISAFTMKDGEVITVLKGWGQGTTLKPLSKAYKAACGPFGTTLGPNADRYHQDHFHFDTAKHRGGPYCR